jgi:hypothetical protein
LFTLSAHPGHRSSFPPALTRREPVEAFGCRTRFRHLLAVTAWLCSGRGCYRGCWCYWAEHLDVWWLFETDSAAFAWGGRGFGKQGVEPSTDAVQIVEHHTASLELNQRALGQGFLFSLATTAQPSSAQKSPFTRDLPPSSSNKRTILLLISFFAPF